MGDLFNKLAEAGKTFFSYMTPGRLLLLVMTGLAVIGLTGSWENRGVLFENLKADKFASKDYVLTNLSPLSQASIKSFVLSDTNIVAIQVLRTDFIKLTRDTVYFHSEVAELQRDFQNYYDSKSAPTPVMVMGEEEQNARMIAIINQQFVCVPLTPSILSNLPSAQKYATQICSISVPPRYGDMVGYITIYMREPITQVDAAYYQSLARLLANEIYKRDIISRPYLN